MQKFGSRPCTNFFGKTLTYQEIGQLAGKAAAGLQGLGVRQGTKVGLFLPNCPTYLIYYFGILKAGGIVVNYNPLYTLEELTFQLADSQTELLVTLDLRLLFDKVEALIKAGALPRAIVASFSAQLPATKSVLFSLFKSRDLARPDKSAVAAKFKRDADVMGNAGTYQKVHVDAANDIAVLQLPTGRRLGRQSCARPGALAGGPSLLSRLCHDGGHELCRVGGCRAYHHAALRAR